MNPILKYILCCLFLAFISNALTGQSPLFVPRNIQAAYDKGSRSLTGKPGASYKQNKAAYTINVTLNPVQRQVEGSETILYKNNSSDTLKTIYIKLIQNGHRRETFRAYAVDELFYTDGISVSDLKMNGTSVDFDNEKVWNSSDPTNAGIPLATPLKPGEQLTVALKWSFTLQQSSDDHREGMVDSTAFFCAYWYPRICVYDDIDGWDRVPFNDQIEFYNEFSDYDVTINVPNGNIIWATGDLQNISEVLEDRYATLLEKSMKTDSLMTIVSSADLRRGGITKNKPVLSWHFKVNDITDFAFGSSDHFIWQATSTVADGASRRRVSVQTAYKETSEDYPHVLGIAQKCIAYFSKEMPGIPYPYPKMTVFNGYGQMEYPMMCNDIEQENLDDTHTLTAHEIAHTYFPFLMGINEGRYAWMDEGWATFFEYHACTETFELEDATSTFPGYYMRGYMSNHTLDVEVPMLSPSNQLLGAAYGINSYGKPASAYAALESLLGKVLFKKCLSGYVERWRGKHPTPYDFFYTFNDLSGKNLDWFWKRWFMEYNALDINLGKIEASGNGKKLKVTVLNPGGKPVPVILQILAEDGTTKTFEYSPAIWENTNAAVLSIKTDKPSKEITLSSGPLMDINLAGNKVRLE